MLTISLAMSAAVSTATLEPEERHRTTGVRAEIGIAAPTGFVGASLSRDVATAFRLEGGLGFGLSGLQLSMLGRFVLGNQNHHFVPALGFSLGIPVGDPIFRDSHGGPSVIMSWLNADVLGYEYMADNGWAALIAIGVTSPLRHAHWDAFGDMGGQVRPLRDWYPEAHVAFGKAF